jgi:RND family efflux transporter MFP subunit
VENHNHNFAGISMLKQTLILLSLVALLAGCGDELEDASGSKGTSSADTAPAGNSVPAMLIAEQDLVDVSGSQIATGPIISGSLQAEKQADLRAEVSAIVMQVLKDDGDAVEKGDLLVRLDDTAFRQSLNSAQEAERVAQQSFDQAERQLTRLKTLSSSGAVSIQAEEDAELRRSTAQSELAGARTRVVQESQQLARTEVRAPFAGIVGGREVSNGDTAQIGMALLKVIDPSSIRFSGFIPSDQIRLIDIGQIVNFRVNGQSDQEFEGRIERINPVADPSTRQVGVQVAITGDYNLTVGLFAEGRVQTEVKQGISVPESSLVREGDQVYVWRVKDGVLNKVEVGLGVRDVQSGAYAINAGLADGDQVLRHPLGALVDGASIELKQIPLASKEG